MSISFENPNVQCDRRKSVLRINCHQNHFFQRQWVCLCLCIQTVKTFWNETQSFGIVSTIRFNAFEMVQFLIDVAYHVPNEAESLTSNRTQALWTYCVRIVQRVLLSPVLMRMKTNSFQKSPSKFRIKSTLTLLLAVAPPAHSKLRKLYDDTLTFQVLRLNDNVPTVPQRRNAA